MYIQVNIGRNFAPNEYNKFWGELSELEWENFIQDVELTLDRYREHTGMGDALPEVHRGTGFWNERAEESAHISLYHEGGFDLEAIRSRLAQLKKEYSQETIGLIVGSELI